MKKKIIVFILFSMAVNCLYAQKITGSVFTVDNNQPLIAAWIKVVGYNSMGEKDMISAFTDIEGKFSLEINKLFNCTLIVSYAGYNSINATVKDFSIAAAYNSTPPNAIRIEYKPTLSNTTTKNNPPKPILSIDKLSIRIDDENENGIIDAFEKCRLFFELKNTGDGNAYKLKTKINTFGSSSGVKFKNKDISIVTAGGKANVHIPINTDGNTIDGKLSFTIAVEETNGLSTDEYVITVPTKSFNSSTSNIAGDIDNDIPLGAKINSTTFAVIIANENYADEVKVDHALNDGVIFKQYCEKTLGIPTDNIHLVQDATYGKLISEKNWLTNNLKAYKGDAKAIFYYAGHGIPGGQDQPAYLLPVDGSSSDVASAMKLDDLYKTLTENPNKGVTVFLDACFSGSTRDAGMLASARGTKLKPRESTLPGNLVVFSAASGDETAWPYKDKQHGMFTYYLLKKLQETKGDVTYQALADYINDNVYKTAIKLNNKPQTPTTKAGTEAIGWEGWKLK